MSEIHSNNNNISGERVAELASPASRFLAFLIDSLIFGLISFGLEVTFGNVPFVNVTFVDVVLFVVITSYFVSIHQWQATIGKRIVGIHIVDINGSKISLQKAIIRTTSFFIFIVFISVPLTLFLYNNKTEDKNVNLPEELEQFFLDYTPDLAKKIEESGLKTEEFLATRSNEIIEPMGSLDDEQKIIFKKLVVDNIINLDIFKMFIYSFLSFFVWYVSIFFTKQRTAFHDIIAKTRVIKGKL